MKPTRKVFSNPLLEHLSHTAMLHVLVVYLPIFFISLYLSTQVNIFIFLPLFIVGAFIWTLTEYTIHRFVFHSFTFQQHFPKFYLIIHGIHHENTLDKNRLLVPLYVSLPLGGLLYFLFLKMLGVIANPLFSGFIFGYLSYDIIHYRIHHYQPQTAIAKFLRAYHFRHHFKDHSNNFGVSSPLWDRVFGSQIPTE